MIIGVDISGYDPLLNWGEYSWDFAFVKASEGTVIDGMFRRQWAAARGYTIRSPYHYFRPMVDPIISAQRFVEYIGDDLGELPPVMDLETTDARSDTPARGLVWCKEVYRLIKRKPIIYTSLGFANYIGLYKYDEYSEYRLWLAEYPWDKIQGTWTEESRKNKIYNVIHNPDTYPFPSVIEPFNSIDFAQWTGKCPPEYVPGYPLGFKLAVDINFYKWDMKRLFMDYNIQYIPKGDTMPEDRPITFEADLLAGKTSNLRYQPGLDAGFKGSVIGPAHVQGVGEKVRLNDYDWVEIVQPAGWIAITSQYVNVKWIEPDPQPIPTPTPTPTEKTIIKSVLHWKNADGTVSTEELFPK